MSAGPVRAGGAASAATLAWSPGPSPWRALLVLLAPDLGIAACALGSRLGLAASHALHPSVGPAILGALLIRGEAAPGAVAALQAARIGVGPAPGCGLEHPTAFSRVQPRRIGRG